MGLKKYTLSCFLCLISLVSFGQQAEINTIHDRMVAGLLSGTVDVTAVTGFVNNMKADGSWGDINYADKSRTGWKPLTHVNRLTAMAVAYRKPGTTFYNSSSLRDKIVLGYNYYFTYKPVSDNWFYNNISGPRNYGQGLLLLKGYIPSATLLKYSAYLVDRIDQYIVDGDNLMGVSMIAMYKASMENNFALMNKAFDAIASSLSIWPSVPAPNLGDVGIKADFSFHQHRQQLYIGGYGIAYMQSIMSYIELAEGTIFANQFTPARKQLYSDVMLKGVQSFGYRGVLDFGSMGRYISRANGTKNIDAATLDKIKVLVDPDNASLYDAWKNHLTGGPAATSGNRHFWKSDIMTQHGPNYYLSAKIISLRTLGTETINDESLKNYYLPLGATNIMTGGDEYKNIFPTWDWSRIPGTTAEMDPNLAPKPLVTGNGYLYGTNQFAGGVSNGSAGATAFEHDYYGVKAKKSYFFMGDMMLCMGTGINAAKSNNVVTSINQCYLSGAITASTNAGLQTYTGNNIYQDLKNLQWVHHDNVAYIMPGASVTLQAKNQTGSWKSINNAQSGTVVKNDVFSLWFNHSSNPGNRSYMYIVAPDKTVDQTKTLSANHGFVVAQNDGNAQAVRNDNVRQYAVVFYNPGSVDMGNGLTITSDKKAIVLIEKKGTPTYKISVADPMYNQSGVTIKLNKNVTGSNAAYANGTTSINFTFPTGEYTGSTVNGFYTIKEPQVAIATPISNSTFNAPAMCTISATTDITSTNINIAKVEFFNGTIKLGEDITAPYSFNWTNISAGTYSITAKATDIHGIYGVSAPVTIKVNNPDLSACTSVIASTNDGNIETNVLDNNLSTRWSADGDGQWIQFCLSQSKFVNGVQIATFNGNTRKSIFDVLLSQDGINWTKVISNASSSGTSLNLEPFNFASQQAKYIRIVGHGNSINTWNSYSVVKIDTPIPTITFANTSKTYGDASFTAKANSNSTGVITYSITSGSQYASITPAGQVTIKGVGAVTIQASQAAGGGYNSGISTSILTINKAALTITADSKTKIYNTANPSLTLSYSGFVNGESSSALTTIPTLATTAVTVSNAGNYPITLSGGSANNYNITFVNGTLTVTKATPTISYTSAIGGYQGTSINLTSSSNSGGAISYSVTNGTGIASLSGNTLNLSQTGNVTLTILVAATNNYITSSIQQIISIYAPNNPGVSLNNITKTYGDGVFNVNATTSSNGAITYSITSGSQYATITSGGQVTIKRAGTVTIQASQAPAGIYTSGSAAAILTINKAELTITAVDKSKTYNMVNPVLTMSYSGFVNGENISDLTSQPAITTTAVTGSDAGNYPIILNGGSANNYNINLVDGTLIINKAIPTINYTSATRGNEGSFIDIISSTNSTGTVSYSVTNSTGSASLSGNTLSLIKAGSVTLAISVDATQNYFAASAQQTISIISQIDPGLNLNDIDKTYGDGVFSINASSNSNGAITYAIIFGGQFASITPSGQVTIKGAGTVVVQANQTAQGNYTSSTAIATLTINKAILTITADNKTKIYNASNPELTMSFTGFVNDENSSVITTLPDIATMANTVSDVGNYPITLSGGTTSNYDLTFVDGTLSITKSNTPELIYSGETSGAEGETIELSASSFSTGDITYQLLSGGTGTASLDGNQLNLESSGTVIIQITIAGDANFDSQTITQQIIINPITNTGISAKLLFNSQLHVYPNPIIELANIEVEIPESTNGKLVLFDVNGMIQEIISEGIVEKSSTFNIAMTKYANGIYILKLETDKGVLVKKISKQ